MELWIRSQDKCTLEKITYLSVGGTYRNEILADDCCSIGKYKSKERALEVLDEIQKRIINLQLVSLEEKGKARKDVYSKSYLECVYEMPKE